MTRCACWDGPFSAVDRTLVSVRCDTHADVPPLEGHVPMLADEAIAAAVADAADRVAELREKHGGKIPEQVPSVEVCVEQCGSRCCRTEGMAVFLRDEEVVRLKRLATAQRIPKLPVLHHGRPNGRNLWRYSFASTGGRCVFLGDDGLCRIYGDRPNACRTFPYRPVAGCLVWPDPDATEGGVLPAAATP